MAKDAATTSDETKQEIDWAALTITLTAIVANISLSAGLINFNKYLMDQHRFPFSIVLVMIHMIFGSCFNGSLFLAKPQFFPTLQGSAWKAAFQDTSLRLRIGFICLLFAGQLILTNTAYLKSSVPFLQMMKESNLVWVYFISCMVAIEPLMWQRLLMVGLILGATALTIHGEMRFSFQGFCIQGSSQLMESFKIVLQGRVLQNAGLKVDPLSYVLITSPICLVLLSGAFFVVKSLGPNDLLQLPAREDLKWWPWLLANAAVALGLNISMAFLLQRIKPFQFVLVGITKDICVVLISVLYLREQVSSLQCFGFTAQICLIFLWNYLFTSAPRQPQHKQHDDAEAAIATKAMTIAEYGTKKS